MDESIEVLRGMAEIGAPKLVKNSVLAGLRSWPVKGFEDILIFCIVQPDTLRVVRVLRRKRDIGKIPGREKSDGARQ